MQHVSSGMTTDPSISGPQTLRRGHLYRARLDKLRPVLVLSPDYRNERASDVIAIPLSTRLRNAPTHVRIRRKEGGASAPSVLKCEQITTIPRDLVGSVTRCMIAHPLD